MLILCPGVIQVLSFSLFRDNNFRGKLSLYNAFYFAWKCSIPIFTILKHLVPVSIVPHVYEFCAISFLKDSNFASYLINHFLTIIYNVGRWSLMSLYMMHGVKFVLPSLLMKIWSIHVQIIEWDVILVCNIIAGQNIKDKGVVKYFWKSSRS